MLSEKKQKTRKISKENIHTILLLMVFCESLSFFLSINPGVIEY